ncbi:General secretion pathway protein G [Enhygromyxa salina]|uniref:General secretion pathway protein G n=1 Tax=Enhygromyxa salina TaxID=215803 RepID=A0A0C1ZZT2_9BACT|nr:type II secretion system protein GspG [Enhygromyxa salina]KIG16668.1 General secretion pathway protein G [Enhygromyxa salina]
MPTPQSTHHPSLAIAARGTRGMTLIEILVVLAIIGLIMGGVAVVSFNALTRAKYKTAAKDIAALDESIAMYRLQRSACPKTSQDLVDAGIIKKIFKDPWGSEYVFTCPGKHGEIDISSPGNDQELATPDDVNSWDEDLGELPEDG